MAAARLGEPRVDEDRAFVVAEHPHEVVHPDRSVVLPVDVVVQEHLGAVSAPRAVLDDDDLVLVAHPATTCGADGHPDRRSSMRSRRRCGGRPVNRSTTSVTFAMLPERTIWPNETMPSLHHGTGEFVKSPVASRGTPSASHIAYISSSERSTI